MRKEEVRDVTSLLLECVFHGQHGVKREWTSWVVAAVTVVAVTVGVLVVRFCALDP